MNVQMQVTHVTTYYSNKRCKNPRHADLVGRDVRRVYDYTLRATLSCGATFESKREACRRCLGDQSQGTMVVVEIPELRHWHGDDGTVFWPWSLSISALHDYVDARVHSAMDFTRWTYGEPIAITVPALSMTLRPCEASQ